MKKQKDEFWHKDNGNLLKEIRSKLFFALKYSRGSMTKKESDYLDKCIKYLDKYRSVCDDKAARDLGEKFSAKIYYGIKE